MGGAPIRCVVVAPGETRTVRAAKEVLVCGGTINSPHLLQVSGLRYTWDPARPPLARVISVAPGGMQTPFWDDELEKLQVGRLDQRLDLFFGHRHFFNL